MKIEMDEQDRNRRQKSRHEWIRAERVDGSRFAARHTQRIRDELADGSEIRTREKIERTRVAHAVESQVRAREHEIIHGQVHDESKVDTR